MVGNSNSVSVTTQIIQDFIRSPKRRLCIYDPFSFKTFFYKLCKRFRIREMTDFPMELQPFLFKAFRNQVNKEASVEPGKDTCR